VIPVKGNAVGEWGLSGELILEPDSEYFEDGRRDTESRLITIY